MWVAYLLRCLKRNTAVLKLTGGSEWRRVSKHWALASGSDKPAGGGVNTSNHALSTCYFYSKDVHWSVVVVTNHF